MPAQVRGKRTALVQSSGPSHPSAVLFVWPALYFFVAWNLSSRLERLASEPGTLLSVSPNTWITGQNHHAGLFLHGFWGLKLRSLGLEGKHFMDWLACSGPGLFNTCAVFLFGGGDT